MFMYVVLSTKYFPVIKYSHTVVLGPPCDSVMSIGVDVSRTRSFSQVGSPPRGPEYTLVS